MFKRIILGIISAFCILNISAQNIETENVKVKNKLSFGLVTPEPQNNGRFPQKVGDVYVNGTDTSLTMFRGNVRGYEKIATVNQTRQDMSDSIANMKAGVFNVLDAPFNATSGTGTPNDTTAINAAIRAASMVGGEWGDEGIVYIPPGIYDISGGIVMQTRVKLLIAKNATLFVPSGYTGAAIIFPDGVDQSDVEIDGGYFIERFPHYMNWTGIKIYKTNSNYYAYSTIRNVLFQWVGTGIDINLATNGWVNENEFNRIHFKGFRTAVISHGITGSQSQGNKFISCGFQATDSTEYGVEKMMANNQFIGCTFWDFDAADNLIAVVSPEVEVGNEFTNCKELPFANRITSELSNQSSIEKVTSTTITYSRDGVADTIAYLPNTAIIWDIKIRIGTNFNDSGTDLLNIGYAGYDDFFVANHDVSTGVFTFPTLTQANTWPSMVWDNNYITATYNGENNNMTSGSVTVFIRYSLP